MGCASILLAIHVPNHVWDPLVSLAPTRFGFEAEFQIILKSVCGMSALIMFPLLPSMIAL